MTVLREDNALYKKKGISQSESILINIFFVVFSVLCLVPFLLVISISFSNETDIVFNGYRLIPENIDLLAYKYILANPRQLLRSYFVSISTTAVGTFVSVILMALAAYPLTRPDYRLKRFVSFYYFFTMLFSGGLVPFYILITQYLKWNDTWWVLWVPSLISAWYIFMLRTFIKGIPDSIFESAKIDGASEFRIFFSLVMPLSKPALATVAFYGVLNRWNDWFTPLLFISEQKLMPVQYLLYRIMSNIDFIAQIRNTGFSGLGSVKLPGETARMAMCVLAAGPIVFVFPFFQKYFVKGITVGSVKG